MVTSYPPTHCGIAAYSEQAVNHLRSQGHVVDVLSPDGQGNVDFAWDLRGGWNVLKLRKLFPYYDKIVLQYVWSFYYRDPFSLAGRIDTLKTTLSFIGLFLISRKIEIVAHEIPYMTGRSNWLYRLKWKLAPKLVLHTGKERERLEQHYHMRLKDSRVELREHHGAFRKFSGHSQASARRELGVVSDACIFLCIGFIQRHKGFDRAIRAFQQANLPNAMLYVVGSMRVKDEENQEYLAELYELAKGRPNVKIVESFVSNEEFDSWIAAADWVIFPYSGIWSSGVMARTRLLDRPAIVACVGGLPDQAGERDLLFHDDAELLDALHHAAAVYANAQVRR